MSAYDYEGRQAARLGDAQDAMDIARSRGLGIPGTLEDLERLIEAARTLSETPTETAPNPAPLKAADLTRWIKKSIEAESIEAGTRKYAQRAVDEAAGPYVAQVAAAIPGWITELAQQFDTQIAEFATLRPFTSEATDLAAQRVLETVRVRQALGRLTGDQVVVEQRFDLRIAVAALVTPPGDDLTMDAYQARSADLGRHDLRAASPVEFASHLLDLQDAGVLTIGLAPAAGAPLRARMLESWATAGWQLLHSPTEERSQDLAQARAMHAMAGAAW